jgi:disulfide bond formation protein DsbB
MLMPQTTRSCWLFLFAISSMMLSISLILQQFMQLVPCSLCIFSRVSVIIVLIVSFVALIISNNKFYAQLTFSLFTFLALLFAMIVSIRHVWVLSLPPSEVPACGPGLNYLIETLPWQEVIATVLQGSGECAKSANKILGIPLAHWTLGAFILMCLIWLLLNIKLFSTRQKKGG